MLLRKKKAQSTAEYAILFALVVAAAMGVQGHVKRALQARVYDATTYLVQETGTLGNTLQWEPTDSSKETVNQKSSRDFVEDYENGGDTPYTYTESSSADIVTSRTTQ